jgi:uncharacterized protein
MNFLNASWENLIMANYAVDPSVLIPFLPRGVSLDTFNGQCYVSLVGFMFNDTRIFKVPVPYLGSFEEINLRFYVKRESEEGIKRGVVFINETVPHRAVAWVANKLYKEHYVSVPTKHDWNIGLDSKKIEYSWKKQNSWEKISVHASTESSELETGSVEEFIFEHYHGYTKVNDLETLEYQVNHPRWKINKVMDFNIECDFLKMYGPAFEFLKTLKPDNVLLAEGSAVSVKWRRNKI